MNKKELILNIKRYLQSNIENEVSDLILFGSQNNQTVNNSSDYDISSVTEIPIYFQEPIIPTAIGLFLLCGH